LYVLFLYHYAVKVDLQSKPEGKMIQVDLEE